MGSRGAFRGRMLPIAMVSALCFAPYVHGAGATVDRPPLLYVIDYSANHMDNPNYLARLAEAPPHFLHVGKDTPMSHNWGPIAGWGGENVYTGGGEREAYLRRLSAQEALERLETIRRFTEGVHAAGVDKVMPYVCGMTIGGDPQARSGFWEFYDHWDEYAALGIGPRPDTDPEQWLQRRPDGSPLFIYEHTTGTYAPAFRWAVCMNNPGWRQWMAQCIGLVAQVGYDGVFVDNAFCRCYCEHCREGFAAYAGQRGFADAQMVTQEEGGLNWLLTQEFWIESIARWLTDMRQAGRAFNGDFAIFPNFGTLPGYTRFADACDYQMGEGAFFGFSRGGFGTIWFHPAPGETRRRVVEDIELSTYASNAWEFRYTAAAGGRPGYVALTHGISGGQNSDELKFAEAAAFGSGAACFGRGGTSTALLARWREFLSRHGGLYTGVRPHARVGLLFMPRQAFYENLAHCTAVRRVAGILDAAGIVYRMVTEEEFNSGQYADVEILIMPQADYLSSAGLEGLLGFAQNKKVIIVEAMPAHDERFGALPDDRLQLLRLRTTLTPLHDQALLAALAADGGADLAVAAPQEGINPHPLRFEVRRDDAARRLVVHCVNYRVPVTEAMGQVVPAREVKLTIPLPDGWEVADAAVFSPEMPDFTAPLATVTVDGPPRTVQFTLDSLNIYSIVELRCRP